MFCTQCGKEIKKKTSFCTNCGFQFNYEVNIKTKKINNPTTKGRIDLKSIKFLDNPILNFIVLLVAIFIAIPALPIIIPLAGFYFIFNKILKIKNN